MVKKEYFSNSPQDTEKIAEDFAKGLQGGEVIAFIGNLGMGKTCFTRGLAKGLGFSGEVTSPTFALVNEYRGGRLDIFHFDMYRVEGWEDLYSTGYFDYLDEGGVTVIEWSENISSALDADTIYINIVSTGENSRRIIIGKGEVFEDTRN
ncbi:MAG: tRNA (adenosine(37)-N6)-threonylcarbamoyltransferase complex ATPase subunit type 1 TsaE [Clostridia bacterium]|nr:tRNA (adenosine(37)-N6)-threonylcarbamoyltransferase complex ATPase subunit type 1 TsaE [Clostridia bacterium]